MEQRAADKELLAVDSREDVFHRQFQLIDEGGARGIETDERASGPNERLDRLYSFCVGALDRGLVGGRGAATAAATSASAADAALEHARFVAHDEHVERIMKRAFDVRGGEAQEVELVLTEHPPRPAFVHARVGEKQ